MAETSTVDAVVETKHTVRVPASVSRICLTAGAVFSLFLWGFWAVSYTHLRAHETG